MQNPLLPAPNGDLYGFIDGDGTWKIPPQFENASRFVNGFAQVQTPAGLAWITEHGDRLPLPPFYEMRPVMDHHFCAAVVPSSEPNEKTWFVFNLKGETVAGPFEWCSLSSEGLLRVKNGDEWLYLDQTFQPVLTLKTDWAGDLLSGRIRVIQIGERISTRFLDQEGLTKIEDASGEFEDFSEERCLRKTPSGLYELWDTTGKVLKHLPHEDYGTFSEGLCSFRDREHFGFIRRDGEIAIGAVFDEAVEFSSGLAAVRKDESWFFIDTKGQKAFAEDFDRVEDFIDGFALVLKAQKRAYINQKGETIWEEKR